MSTMKLGMFALLCALLATIGAHAMTRPHPDANTARTRLSAAGQFTVSYVPEVSPVPVRELHAWTFEVRSRDGHSVDHAELILGGGMPDHGHGLPTQPRVKRALGAGRYLVDGMKFNMGGYWVVDVAIRAGSVKDRVRFELNL